MALLLVVVTIANAYFALKRKRKARRQLPAIIRDDLPEWRVLKLAKGAGKIASSGASQATGLAQQAGATVTTKARRATTMATVLAESSTGLARQAKTRATVIAVKAGKTGRDSCIASLPSADTPSAAEMASIVSLVPRHSQSTRSFKSAIRGKRASQHDSAAKAGMVKGKHKVEATSTTMASTAELSIDGKLQALALASTSMQPASGSDEGVTIWYM